MLRIPALSLTAFVSATLFAAAPSAHARVSLAAGTRTLWVTVTDKSGAPVEGLTAADFVVKEGGKERDVVEAGPAVAPMRVALVVDDNGTGIFRAGVARFIQRLQGRAMFALSTVNGQHQKLVDYTADGGALTEAIGRLTARPASPDGGQLLEGIFETAKDLERREARRAVIVVLTVGGEEHSTLPAHHVLDQLQKSGAALHVISIAAGALRSTAAVQRPSEMLESNLNLSEVLGDGPKQSGGRRDEIVASAGLVPGLQLLADTLTHQYAVAYAQPDGVKAAEKINVSVKRSGLTVRAPSRAPRW